VAPAASGALTLIATNTLSGVTSSTFNDVFSSTYTNYKIIYNLRGTSQTSDITMRLRASGSDNSSSNYYWSSYYTTSASLTVFGERSNGTNTSWTLNYADTTGMTGCNIDLYSPQETAYTAYTIQAALVRISASTTQAVTTMGGLSVDTAYTGFTILGTQDLTGTVSVYGYGK
jgi:hypothetical protein